MATYYFIWMNRIQIRLKGKRYPIQIEKNPIIRPDWTPKSGFCTPLPYTCGGLKERLKVFLYFSFFVLLLFFLYFCFVFVSFWTHVLCFTCNIETWQSLSVDLGLIKWLLQLSFAQPVLFVWNFVDWTVFYCCVLTAQTWLDLKKISK